MTSVATFRPDRRVSLGPEEPKKLGTVTPFLGLPGRSLERLVVYVAYWFVDPGQFEGDDGAAGFGTAHPDLAEWFARRRLRQADGAQGVRPVRRASRYVDVGVEGQGSNLRSVFVFEDFGEGADADGPADRGVVLADDGLARCHGGTDQLQNVLVGREISLHRGALPGASSTSLAAQLLGRVTTASRIAARAEMQRLLQDAINTMDPIDREVIALRHFEELSNEEAALVLGLNKAAASKRYVRAMLRLKAVLDGIPGVSDPTRDGLRE